MDDELEDLACADAATRAQHASELVARHQDAVTELSRIRREALNELVAEGKTQRELAELLGMTRARIGQLLSSGPKPERALLGTGAVTITVGGKPEGPRVNPSTVVSAEATKARDLIAETAASYDLATSYEVVDPPGMVNLNRSNLIVIGSPRLLPFVAQVLEADSNLGFGSGAQGWYLRARTVIHRSPSDQGKPADYAYIGRLPRPDSKGTFLYLETDQNRGRSTVREPGDLAASPGADFRVRGGVALVGVAEHCLGVGVSESAPDGL